jgi:hypothetical protein
VFDRRRKAVAGNPMRGSVEPALDAGEHAIAILRRILQQNRLDVDVERHRSIPPGDGHERLPEHVHPSRLVGDGRDRSGRAENRGLRVRRAARGPRRIGDDRVVT